MSAPRASEPGSGVAVAVGAIALAICLGLVVGGRWMTLLFALGAASFPALLLWLGARRAPAAARRAIAALGLWLVLATALVIWLAETRSGWTLAGLPVASWIMLLAIALAPLPWIVLAYLRAFDDE